jgi:hypothetical protein
MLIKIKTREPTGSERDEEKAVGECAMALVVRDIGSVAIRLCASPEFQRRSKASLELYHQTKTDAMKCFKALCEKLEKRWGGERE